MTPFSTSLGTGAQTLLVVCALKSALVFVFALAGMRLVTGSFPEVRHLFLKLCLAVALLLPIMSIVLPMWDLSLSGPLGSLTPFNITSIVSTAFADGASNGGTVATPQWITWVLLVGLIGALVVLIRFGYSLLLTWRILRNSVPVADKEVVKLFNQLVDEFEIRRSLRLAASPAVSVPFVWTLFRPTIVVPTSAQSWNPHELSMMLLHEFAHVKRNDSFWMMIGSLATVLYWFNPLVWMVQSKLRLESERACDDYVLHSGANASAYAEFLVGWARRVRRFQAIVPAGSGILTRKQLEVRVMSILSNRIHSLGVKRLTATCVWALILLFAFPLAAVQLVDSKQAPDSTEKHPQKQEKESPAPDSFIAYEVAPVAINLVQPVYPDSAKRSGLEGSVWVKVLIDKNGKVRDALIYKTSGHKMFDDAALDAAKKGQWKPAEKGGKPVAVWVAYEIKFRLK